MKRNENHKKKKKNGRGNVVGTNGRQWEVWILSDPFIAGRVWCKQTEGPILQDTWWIGTDLSFMDFDGNGPTGADGRWTRLQCRVLRGSRGCSVLVEMWLEVWEEIWHLPWAAGAASFSLWMCASFWLLPLPQMEQEDDSCSVLWGSGLSPALYMF